MTWIDRPATPGDLDGIMAIERASFPTDAWTDRMMRDVLRDHDCSATVVVESKRIVAYAAVLAPVGADDADVLTLAVDADHRGAGLGRRLMAGIVASARSRGAQRVFLEVRADNPVAQRLYTSSGFEAVGLRPRYYQPDDVDAVVMRLDLPAGAA